MHSVTDRQTDSIMSITPREAEYDRPESLYAACNAQYKTIVNGIMQKDPGPAIHITSIDLEWS